MERVRGIEPPYRAWEARVLPLNYTRDWSEDTGSSGAKRSGTGGGDLQASAPLPTRSLTAATTVKAPTSETSSAEEDAEPRAGAKPCPQSEEPREAALSDRATFSAGWSFSPSRKSHPKTEATRTGVVAITEALRGSNSRTPTSPK